MVYVKTGSICFPLLPRVAALLRHENKTTLLEFEIPCYLMIHPCGEAPSDRGPGALEGLFP